MDEERLKRIIDEWDKGGEELMTKKLNEFYEREGEKIKKRPPEHYWTLHGALLFLHTETKRVDVVTIEDLLLFLGLYMDAIECNASVTEIVGDLFSCGLIEGSADKLHITSKGESFIWLWFNRRALWLR